MVRVGVGGTNPMGFASRLHTEPHLSRMRAAGREGPAAQPSLVSSDLAAHRPSEGAFLPAICLALGIGDAQLEVKGSLFVKGEPACSCVCVHSGSEKSWPDCSLGGLTPKVCVPRSVPEARVWTQSRCLQPPSHTQTY